jgi:type II secretory pathway pseudopilin PulG
MKLGESTFNKMRGQSLLELILAIGIFLILILVLSPLFLDTLNSSRLSQEFLIADFLAKEGLEAARSIRDNNWEDLTPGNHGLSISDSHFVFYGEEEDVSGQLREGKRKIQIENIDNYRKKVTSTVSWQFAPGKTEKVELITHFTNWKKTSQIEIRKPTAYTDYAKKTTNPQLAYDYPDGSTFASTFYSLTANPSIIFYSFETSTKIYTQLILKFRYNADGANDDKYAVAYSTTTCQGTFIDLIPPSSAFAPDTTVSVELPPNLNLSSLCIKIYTQRVGAADNKYFYTRDIWVEGYYLE